MQKENTKAEKLNKRRLRCLYAAAFLSALAINILGILVGKDLDPDIRYYMPLVSLAFLLLPCLMLFLSRRKAKKYEAQLNSYKVAERQSFLISHRDAAEETAAEKLALLNKLITKADISAVMLGLCGAMTAFSAGTSFNVERATPVCLAAIYIIICAFGRIRFKPSTAMLDEDRSCVSEQDYPEIYAVIRRAQNAMGDTHEIRLSLSPDNNMGIALLNDICIVYIGVTMLSICSEDELYTIMLHEFSHIEARNPEKQRVEAFASREMFGRSETNTFALTELMFRYSEYRFSFEHYLYSYASSLIAETDADCAMAKYGSPELAASMLLKLKYCELFEWESQTEDNTPDYAYAEPYTHFIEERLNAFNSALPERMEHWNELTRREIPSRSATHPCVNMRIAALGVSEYRAFPSGGSVEYLAECKKAVTYVEELYAEFISEGFEESRKRNYLEPLERVEKWEAEGKPVIAETYEDIATDLVRIGRKSEVTKLCEKAIDSLPESAAPYAHFMKGEYLMRHYDDAGIEHMYRAIEGNPNYFESGIVLIGQYCCLTGNQTELDRYREKAVILEQEQIDHHSEAGILRKTDKLSAESLPDGMLEDALAYIASVDKGEVEEVYLVRKTVSEDFFTSVFILKLSKDTEPDRRYDILHSVFRYLDTCSDWQFSLFDCDELPFDPGKIDSSLVWQKSGKNNA